MTNYISKKVRLKVSERANGYCEYCMSPSAYAPSIFSIEHIIPKAIKIDNNLSNLALACNTCNSHKFTKISYLDSVTMTETALYNPRKDYWLNHFRWNEEGTLILGITAKGRATLD